MWPVVLALGAVAAAFAVTRSLSPFPLNYLGSDTPIYLGLAERLPHYALYGGVSYVNHPPLFPILIRLASYGVPLLLAGLAVVVVMQAVGLGLTWRLVRRQGFGPVAAVTVLALLVMNVQWALTAGGTVKETTYVACIIGLLGAWLAAVERPGRSLGIAVCWACAAVASNDQSVFAIAGCQVAILAYAGCVGRWRGTLVLPSAAGALVFCVWLGWRLGVYHQGPEVAVGIGGMLEPTTRLGLQQLLTPQALPNTSAMTGVYPAWPTGDALVHLVRNLFGLAPLHWATTAGLIRQPAIIVTGFASSMGLLGFGRLLFLAVREPDPRRRGFARALLIVSLFLLTPVTVELSSKLPRMFLFLSVPAAIGVADALTVAAREKHVRRGSAIAVLIASMVVTAAVAYASLPQVLWTRPALLEAQVAVDWLNARPPTGVMAQVGYGPELAWKTHHRIFGLPTDPAVLRRQVETHNIRYIIYGTHYWASPLDPRDATLWNGRVIEAVRADPEYYPLATMLEETYMPTPVVGLLGDTLWVHEVAGTTPSRVIAPHKDSP